MMMRSEVTRSFDENTAFTFSCWQEAQAARKSEMLVTDPVTSFHCIVWAWGY
jgi:hypothetical protein